MKEILGGAILKIREFELSPEAVDANDVYGYSQFDGYSPGAEPYNPYFSTFTEFLVLNVMVSAVSTLFVIAVCLTAYYCVSKPSKGRVKWAKVNQNEDIED
eukprot:TRINITY_DN685_c0_g1_i1.p1 TRINITY_DN685_c0_g1~~TRINITY_DN685_c0_g1_i1.p1  ORF type:complete len:101 (-),score=19.88 TRINITY_DN685_c0_g1_i1:45-347(-)